VNQDTTRQEKTDNEQTSTENAVMDRDDQLILSLLTAIDDEPNTTQKDLSTHLGVAVGLVNSYLKRVIYKGYVKTTQLQRRRLRYLLTPKGITEKSRLTYEFLQYSYQYIRKIRSRVHGVMKPYVAQGKIKVIFWGSGEVAELAYLASREMGLEIIAMVDPGQAGKRCVDKDVFDPEQFSQNQQANVLLVLSTPPKEQSTRQRIKTFAEKHGLETVYVL